MNKSVLSIRNFFTHARLGVSIKERRDSQVIGWNVNIYDEKLPQACYTDELSHSTSYESICNIIKELSEQGEYKLLEHLCYKIYTKLKETTKKHIEIEVIKLHSSQKENLIKETEASFKIIDSFNF